MAGELGLTTADVEGVLAAVAPVVGAPRVVAAASKVARAVGLAVAVAAAADADAIAAAADEGPAAG